ncbi:DNA-directed RNA polymerase subunit omega [Megasphaera lornae]|jgi:hypothetical protein|uniref:DNA-directed RNA polymerase subunit omega n=1 Tax=Megasphaera lornae TaxID=1000568 RepID=D3LUS6_9FIRM|nr:MULTISPECIES: DNA-directed RNA polymerase subunit omega [Megasphaera]EFD94075.1 DNA-directed RNA polymerase, omega subunit [Megasphaera genomosp. type_1 str. 28L]EGL39756.1 DNA-directed RNA polymerase, omega subunit [Megasphaera lornae]KXB93406.1 DNA-directed RNA polymerase, omega subunit [Veillonellaceae bacterium DNF00751]MUP49682.1 DNA-directed RNA polymerase subunit omega [Veillonellaceae bacterium M1-70]
MLIKPSLESLMEKVDSKYTLVTLAAKRARELTDGDQPTVCADTNKVVSIAMEEIDAGKIRYESSKTGIK